MEESDGSWGIAIVGVLVLLLLCWKQAGWDQDADPEEYDPYQDCYVMKADSSPAVDTNLEMRLRCK